MRSPFVPLALVVALAACGADETISLLDETTSSAGGGSTAGTGGTGGQGAGCELHAECDPPTPMCDPASGSCVSCPEVLETCGAECIDTSADARHCGRCGQPCLHTQLCVAGQCVCVPGTTPCDGACRDLQSDPGYCSSCDVHCSAGQKCSLGHCKDACDPGLVECPTANGNSACVDLAAGYPRCGSCDIFCAASEVCVDGVCRAYQPASPCTSCPCEGCTAIFGDPAICCPSVLGGASPACVQSDACPR
jgi:hypothetical protein